MLFRRHSDAQQQEFETCRAGEVEGRAALQPELPAGGKHAPERCRVASERLENDLLRR
jgi:hypothetical protein